MNSIINFLTNNTLIFLIIILLLVFALIGYLVDSKNETPTKAPKEKKVKKEKKEKEVKKLIDVAPQNANLQDASIEKLSLGDAVNKNKENEKNVEKNVNNTKPNNDGQTPDIPVIEDAPVLKEKEIPKK